MIERIQTLIPVYQQTSAERIEAQVKKTATADAVSFDEERSQRDHAQQEKEKKKDTPENVVSDAPIAVAKAEGQPASLDIRV